MGFQFSDLTPEMQRLILEQYKQRGEQIPQEWLSSPRPSLTTKYHNMPSERIVSTNRIRFQSQREARRYDELMLMLRGGVIRKLRLQPQFTLQESFISPDGKRVQAIRYTADFSYEKMIQSSSSDTWEFIVEDVKVKATQTPQYRTKKKMMMERFGIEIREV